MSAKVFLTPSPVLLLNFQKQELSALLPNTMVNELQQDRDEQLKHVLDAVQLRGGHCHPAPWTPHDAEQHHVRFQWSEANRPHLLDNACQPLSYSERVQGDRSMVRLALQQKPYLQQDGLRCGTVLRLLGIQDCSTQGDAGEPSFEQVAELFRQPMAHSSTGETLLRSQFIASFL